MPRPQSATRRAVARASSGRPAPERVADQGLRGDRVGVEHQREEEEQLQRDLVRAERRRPDAGRHPGGDEEGQLEHRGAQQQVAADDQLGAQGARARPPGDAAPASSARTNSAAVTACPATLAIAEPASPSPTGCTSSGQSTRLTRLPAST